MSKKYLLQYPIYLLLVLLISGFTACKDKDEDDIKPNVDNSKVNEWIYEEMSDWYKWNDKLPSKRSLNFSSDPKEFFNSLLYTKNVAGGASFYDRYSYIEESDESSNETRASSKTDLGFDFIPSYVNVNNTRNVILIICYVKPNTWAQKNGMKRGMIIQYVNKQKVTEDNWFSILHQNEPKYDLKYTNNLDEYANGVFYDKWSEITLERTTNYKDYPLMLDAVFTIDSKKIGYAVLNTFGDEYDVSNLDDNRHMIERIKHLKDEGITDLILDLRYNRGGLVHTAVYLGSALVPNADAGDVFERKVYNNEMQAYLESLPDNNKTKESYLYDRFVSHINYENQNYNEIPKLGNQLQSLTIIGTENTASASEMIINCLRPYYERAGKQFYLVGEETAGKNVGSWSMKPEDESIKWKIQPITFQTFNVDGKSDYFNGFAPTIPANDFQNLSTGLKELGNKEETLLATALANLRGDTRFIQPQTRMSGSSTMFQPLSIEEQEKRGVRFDMIVDKSELKKIK